MGFAAFTQVPIPKVEAMVLKAKVEKLGAFQLKVENLDVNDIAVRMQESDDDVTYVNMGATVTVKAGGIDTIDAVCHRPFIKVLGSGAGAARLQFLYDGMFLLGNIDVLLVGRKAFGND